MIDLQIIESARSIRREFLRIMNQISSHEKELKSLTDFLSNKMNELKRIHDNEFKKTPTKDEVDRVTQLVFKEISDIEMHEERLRRKFEGLNSDLEKLREEEKVLYNLVKSRYPHLSDEQIKTEIQNQLGE